MPPLLNLVGFLWWWLALVFGAFYDLVWPVLTLFCIWVVVHLRYSRHRWADLRLLVVAPLLGPLPDILLLRSDWIDYVGTEAGAAIPPLWFFALWVNFALILNHSMAWAKTRPIRMALTGAIAGPASYWLGDALGAIILNGPVWIPSLALSLSWLLIFSVLRLCMADRPSPQPQGRPVG